MSPSVRGRLHAISVNSRRRAAAATILLGRDRPRAWDRPVSWLYYSLAAREWSEKAVDENHLVAFEDGLSHCVAPKRAVDVGTGGGASAAAIARRFPDARVEGIDNSKAMLRHAQRLHHEPNLTFRRAVISALPYPDGSIDLVTMLNSALDIDEAARVLTDEGQILMAWSVSTSGTTGSEGMWLARCAQAGFTLVEEGRAEPGRWELLGRQRRG
ncbi:MAG: trans-aconitate 3-methyltransferase [Actinomycetota bacterium]